MNLAICGKLESVFRQFAVKCCPACDAVKATYIYECTNSLYDQKNTSLLPSGLISTTISWLYPFNLDVFIEYERVLPANGEMLTGKLWSHHAGHSNIVAKLRLFPLYRSFILNE
jgi:hypothetical protein